jgi:hypothetical protein
MWATPVRGHDFWIEPSSSRSAPGSLVVLRLRVGEHFVGDPVPRDATLLRRFVVVDADGERPIPGAEGRDPAGLLRGPLSGGTAVVVYESAPSAAEMDRDEGLARLPGVAAATAYPPGRETTRDLFSRHAKALLGPPGAAATTATDAAVRPLGLAFELVPARDPSALAGGGEVGFRVLFRGAPLPGIRVAAIPRDAPREVVAATTGPEGQVTLPLRPGAWLVKAVFAQPAAPSDDAELRSYWASLTFVVPRAVGSTR